MARPTRAFQTNESLRSSFASDYFAQVLHEWILAHLFATLKEQVKRGGYANREAAAERLAEVFDDIAHISTYARRAATRLHGRAYGGTRTAAGRRAGSVLGVKVFSRRNWDALLAWLDALEAGMSCEHRAAVAAGEKPRLRWAPAGTLLRARKRRIRHDGRDR